MFRWLTAGESHGQALVAICDGVPAGVRISSGDVAAALARRRAGYGRGARMKFEQDEVELTGGIEGGMSTGEVLRVRAAMKPISTVPRALDTVDVTTGEPAKAINQRSDVTAVPAAGVVAEAMVALVLAEAATEKFGGDSVEELRRNAEGYLKSLMLS